MEKLSTRELRDIGEFACEKISSNMNDAFQLIDDAEQRAALAYNIAEAAVEIAAAATAAALQATGRRIARREAVLGIIKQMMADEGIEFKQVDRFT